VSAPLAVAAQRGDGRWHWPIDPRGYDTAPAVRSAEAAAIADLGASSLRRLGRYHRAAEGWQLIGRLLRPLDDAAAALRSPPASHHRAALDSSAVVLLRCAETGRSYWAWAEEEWAGLLGRDLDGFRSAAPAWADDAVRLCLTAHAFLLGGFTAFSQLGRLSRLTLARQVFGRDRVDGEIRRIRSVLAQWGYRLGAEDDMLLPMVACQVFLLNRSPHIDELCTGLFDRIRSELLLPSPRLNTLHAMQRAVAYLGFCDPPPPRAGPPPAAGKRRPGRMGAVGGAVACHLHAHSRGPRQRPGHAAQGRALAGGRTSRGRRPGRLDAADLRRLGRGGGPDERRRLRPAHRRPSRPHRQTAASPG
jgi:hypothetical protein